MNPPRSSGALARGDAKLVTCFEAREFTFKGWLRRNDASHVAHIVEHGQELVLKVGSRDLIHNEFAATRELQHDAILCPDEHFEGTTFSALLMRHVEGEPIVDAARRSVPRPKTGLRKNLPMAFGYELNDLGENTFVHCGAEGERLLRLWLGTLGDALTYVHAQKRLHLDIAPDNILVQGSRSTLLDFGLSGRLDEPRPEGALIGSAAYLAPELGLARYTPAADWYSLGVVLFQSLAGGLPFEGGGPEVLVRKQSMSAPRVSELCPEVAPDLDELCASWLTRDPKRRGDGAALASLRA